jgi:nitrogen fixation NifU-like protein
MSETLTRVYDALLMEHIREARNYGLHANLQGVTRIANPLCGDQLMLQTEWQNGVLAEIRFECECCGIAMGNASLMTTLVTGHPPIKVRAMTEHALGILAGRVAIALSSTDASLQSGSAPPAGEAGEAPAWALLEEVRRQLPARRTCASLGWQALQANLDGVLDATAHEVRV